MRKKLKRSNNKTSIENAIVELHELKHQRKMLDARENELKEVINEYVSKKVIPDSKGSYSYYVDFGDEKILYQRQARKKVSLNDDVALKILRKKRLRDAIISQEYVAEEVTNDQIVDALIKSGYEEYIDVKDTVDESILEQLILEGKLTEEEFEKMCDINTTYAVICKKVEETEDYL